MLTDRDKTFRALMLAIFLAAIEATIVSTAMPSIVSELGGLTLYGWVATSYLLASTITVPIFGRAADILGRKPILQGGIAVFLAGSVVCAVAPTFAFLLVGRAIQGLGAGAMNPVSVTLIGDLYRLEERARVQAIVGSVWAIAGVLGPFIGGLLVEGPGWRWIFWANLPLGGASMFLLARSLHDRPIHAERPKIDWAGAALLTFASLGLLLAADGTAIAATLPIGLVAAIGFVAVERRAPAPLLPAALLARRDLAVSYGSAAVVGALLLGVFTYLPLYVQGVLGASPAATGIVLGPMLVGWPAASATSLRLAKRFGFRRIALWGAALATLATGALALLTGFKIGPVGLGATMLVLGMGMGFATTSLLVALQESVAWSERGTATATNLFARSLGSSLGVGTLGAVLAHGLGAGAVAEQVRHILEPGVRQTAVHLDAAAIAVLDSAFGPIFASFLAIAVVQWIVVSLYPKTPARIRGAAEAIDPAEADEAPGALDPTGAESRTVEES